MPEQNKFSSDYHSQGLNIILDPNTPTPSSLPSDLTTPLLGLSPFRFPAMTATLPPTLPITRPMLTQHNILRQLQYANSRYRQYPGGCVPAEMGAGLRGAVDEISRNISAGVRVGGLDPAFTPAFTFGVGSGVALPPGTGVGPSRLRPALAPVAHPASPLRVDAISSLDAAALGAVATPIVAAVLYADVGVSGLNPALGRGPAPPSVIVATPTAAAPPSHTSAFLALVMNPTQQPLIRGATHSVYFRGRSIQGIQMATVTVQQVGLKAPPGTALGVNSVGPSSAAGKSIICPGAMEDSRGRAVGAPDRARGVTQKYVPVKPVWPSRAGSVTREKRKYTRRVPKSPSESKVKNGRVQKSRRASRPMSWLLGRAVGEVEAAEAASWGRQVLLEVRREAVQVESRVDL